MWGIVGLSPRYPTCILEQATAVAFPTASAYVQIVAGTYPITFTDATTGALVLSLDSVVLVAGQTVTVYVIGPAGALGSVLTQDN